MNKELVKKIFPQHIKNVEEGKCASCGKIIKDGEFKDALSAKEFTISGLCQKCQEGVFGESVQKKFFLSKEKAKRLSGLNEERTGSKLFAQSELDNFPKIYSQDGKPKKDVKIIAKLRGPGRWTWYLTEYDPEERAFFGFVKSGMTPDFDELGYVSLTELESTPRIEKAQLPKEGLTLAQVMATEGIV